MARKLTECVALRNPESGIIEVFGPDDAVPTWAALKITNPSVWEGEDVPAPAVDGTAEAGEISRPYGNANKAVWADYARGLNIEVPEDASKADIIALVDAAAHSDEEK